MTFFLIRAPWDSKAEALTVLGLGTGSAPVLQTLRMLGTVISGRLLAKTKRLDN